MPLSRLAPMSSIKSLLRNILPVRHYEYLRRIKQSFASYFFLAQSSTIHFLRARSSTSGFTEKVKILLSIRRADLKIQCPHLQSEMLLVISSILALPAGREGVVVEAGSFLGGSAAKFSQACAMRRRKLVVFDSFEGIPENNEAHDRNIFGGLAKFDKGDWAGSIDLVQKNIRTYGRIEVCEFVKGWFEDTMRNFKRPIEVAYIDVDLASSTRTCLKYLFPLLRPGGIIYSQDGHLPLVIDVLKDERFWNVDVGVKKPRMDGLGSKKIVTIYRD